MRYVIKVLQFCYSIYCLISFIAVMLCIFPFVMLSLPFGKVKGGNMIYRLCTIWGRTWYLLIGMVHGEIYEAPHNRKKQYIFVANHISYLDIPPIVTGVHQPIRALGKAEMVKVPIFGWIYRAAVILVDRSNTTARARSIRALKAVLNKGISIFIFPEGTFNYTRKPLKHFYDGAFRIAIETQTPIKPLLFIDTLNRMHHRSLFELTPGLNRVVYLEEVPVAGLTKEDLPALKQKVYDMMEQGLQRYIEYPVA